MANPAAFIANTFGALLIGALAASMLSGCVSSQVITYARRYPNDSTRMKLTVLLVWMLDLAHTGFIWSSLWEYLIVRYGDPKKIDNVPWSIPITIILTAALTFLVHCFFAKKIFVLSKKNWFITVPIVILAIARLVSASATIVELIRLGFFTVFRAQFKWLFSLGLALSSGVDVLITICLCSLLQMSRTSSLCLDQVIDSLMLYAVESGFLTTAATIVSMICWIIFDNNLIFMGLHFVISKLYANSMLASLNTRQRLRRRQVHTDEHVQLNKMDAHEVDFSVHELADPSFRDWSIQNSKSNSALDHHLQTFGPVPTGQSYYVDGNGNLQDGREGSSFGSVGLV